MQAWRRVRGSSNVYLFLAFALVVLTLGAFAYLGAGRSGDGASRGDEGTASLLNKEILAQAIGKAGAFQEFPTEVDLPIGDANVQAIVEYAFDPGLQDLMVNQFRTYSPDYGAFVAVDAKTGRVLTMVSYARDSSFRENLALRATFPSASVFKVVTAAAAIAERNFSAGTLISFNGGNHTLYKSNVLSDRRTRWTRHMTLSDAFAKSVNTVFGKIGVHSVGAAELAEYASRFGFNRKIMADVPVQEGRAPMPADDWALAESASGYTRENTMSPLQGALIAASIANDGVMMEPYAVQSVYSTAGEALYIAESKPLGTTVDAVTANEIRALMRQTVLVGTSRKAFRGFNRGKNSDVEVGGKTGSLTGMDPPGKYDWFVGYAIEGERRIAVAALTVHQRYWRVKSSHLARRAFEQYFKSVRERDVESASLAISKAR